MLPDLTSHFVRGRARGQSNAYNVMLDLLDDHIWIYRIVIDSRINYQQLQLISRNSINNLFFTESHRFCVNQSLTIKKLDSYAFSIFPLCYVKEGESVAQPNIVTKAMAASACVRQKVRFQNGLFSEKIPF